MERKHCPFRRRPPASAAWSVADQRGPGRGLSASGPDLRVFDTSPRRLERTSLYYVHRIARVLWCLAALAATARPADAVLSVGQ